MDLQPKTLWYHLNFVWISDNLLSIRFIQFILLFLSSLCYVESISVDWCSSELNSPRRPFLPYQILEKGELQDDEDILAFLWVFFSNIMTLKSLPVHDSFQKIIGIF